MTEATVAAPQNQPSVLERMVAFERACYTLGLSLGQLPNQRRM
jgi:hypothetical protein